MRRNCMKLTDASWLQELVELPEDDDASEE